MADLAANDELDRVAASIAAMIHDWYKDGTVAHIPESMIAKRLSRLLAASPLPYSEAVGWRPIESAPKDGTRIIVKAVTFGWSSDVCQNVATGDKAVEARWAKDLSGEYKWLEWCGNDRTHSTDGALVPLGWMPLPAAPVSHGGGRGE